MIRRWVVFAALLVATYWGPRCAMAYQLNQSDREVRDLNGDWLFARGDPAGAESTSFDDSTWRHLTVPHDWSIEENFDRGAKTSGAGAFLPAAVGWYRREIVLPASSAGMKVLIQFDGVMANSDVWVNGVHLGHRPSGYVSFCYDVTKSFHCDGKPNVVAVRVDNSAQPASRWYAGAGIYRNVRFLVLPPVHIVPDSVVVTTPQLTSDSATVHVVALIVNETNAPKSVVTDFHVLSPNGEVVAWKSLPAVVVDGGKSITSTAELLVARPARWDLKNARLYRWTVGVQPQKGGFTDHDDETGTFGIRDAHFEAATGFWLNGVNIKIKGVCLHEDAGAFGVAAPASVWERRLQQLKSIGCNAVRTAHGPPDPTFLDLCDRLGFLVMDEMFDCWTVGKEPYDYHLSFAEWSSTDCADTVRRDRNHPSVILYSVGNEIRDTPNAVSAKATLARLIGICHDNDPTRPVTQALFRPNSSHDYEDGLADELDVIGQNYREPELAAAHAAKPNRRIIGTENGHDRRAWLAVRDNPADAGQFLWTGFDYLGESRAWPLIGSSSGLFDRTGEPRPIAWERASWWSDEPVVHVVRRVGASRATPDDPGFTPLAQSVTSVPDWSPANRGPHSETVEVYSNLPTVELTLNGQLLGSKSLPRDASPRTWSVSFEPGILRAVGKDAGGKEIAADQLKTAGVPIAIRLTAEVESVDSMKSAILCVKAVVVDGDGVPVRSAKGEVTFGVSGPGDIIAVDNGDNASHEPFRSTTRSLFGGQCVAYLRAASGGGLSRVSAMMNGLKAGSLTVGVGK